VRKHANSRVRYAGWLASLMACSCCPAASGYARCMTHGSLRRL
jgi:hypothetical protein